MAINVNALSQGNISVTTSSARTAFTDTVSPTNGILVLNTGTSPLYIQTGDVTVVAAVGQNCVQPNWPRVFEKNRAHTHIAYITQTGTATLNFTHCSSDEVA